MKTARQVLAFWLGFALLAYTQGNSFDRIRYIGGTVETKVKPKEWKNRLTVSADLIKLELKDGQVLDIGPAQVTGLSYGQEAHRRVGTMVALTIIFAAPVALFGLFHKTRLHYVGIEYVDTEGKKQGLLLQAHKKNYRAVLMALRGATGASVSVSEEDRKYVPTGIEVVVSKPTEVEDAEKKTALVSGICHVTSTPPSAEIWVDGSFVGNAPAKLSLDPGKHKIRVALQGYEDWEKELQILPSSEVTLSAVLQKPD